MIHNVKGGGVGSHPTSAAAALQFDGRHDHHGDCTARLGRLTRSVEVPLPYGHDHPGDDAWLDRDGAVHYGDGPYVHRPLRRLRRRLRPYSAGWLR